MLIYTLSQPKENPSAIFYAKSNHTKPSRLRLWVNLYIKLSECYLVGSCTVKDHRRVTDRILQPLTAPHNCFTFTRLIHEVPAQLGCPLTRLDTQPRTQEGLGRKGSKRWSCSSSHRQGQHPLDQGAQDPIQPRFEHFQPSGIHNSVSTGNITWSINRFNQP